MSPNNKESSVIKKKKKSNVTTRSQETKRKADVKEYAKLLKSKNGGITLSPENEKRLLDLESMLHIQNPESTATSSDTGSPPVATVPASHQKDTVEHDQSHGGDVEMFDRPAENRQSSHFSIEGTPQVNIDRSSPDQAGGPVFATREASLGAPANQKDRSGILWAEIDDNLPDDLLDMEEKRQVLGHQARGSMINYLIKTGDRGVNSLVWDVQIPPGSNYNHEYNISKRSDRIIEKIMNDASEKGQPYPMEILKHVRIYGVYWNGKDDTGSESKLDFLKPDYSGRRTPTHCYVYLDPALYIQKYSHFDNKTGWSHETRSTINSICTLGIGRLKKEIAFHNLVVRIENRYQCAFGRSQDRDRLHREIQMDGAGGFIVSDQQPTFVSARGDQYQKTSRDRRDAPIVIESRSPSAAPRRSTDNTADLREGLIPEDIIRGAGASWRAKGKTDAELSAEFHEIYLKSLGKASMTYEELTTSEKALYPLQFHIWKSVCK